MALVQLLPHHLTSAWPDHITAAVYGTNWRGPVEKRWQMLIPKGQRSTEFLYSRMITRLNSTVHSFNCWTSTMIACFVDLWPLGGYLKRLYPFSTEPFKIYCKPIPTFLTVEYSKIQHEQYEVLRECGVSEQCLYWAVHCTVSNMVLHSGKWS